MPSNKKIEAFYEYIDHLPDSVGKRFLLIHGHDYGVKALDSFWAKLCKAHASNENYIQLSIEERRSLAQIVDKQLSRRNFLKRSAATLGALVGAGTIIKTGIDIEGNATADNKTLEDLRRGLLNVPALMLEVVATGICMAMLSNLNEDQSSAVCKVIEGDDKAAIKELVAALDEVFKPLMQAVNETRPFPKKKSGRLRE